MVGVSRDDHAFLPEVIDNDIPNRWTFGSFVHAGPAANNVVPALFERLAGAQKLEIGNSVADPLVDVDGEGNAADPAGIL